MNSEIPFDDPPTSEELTEIARLTQDDIVEIDRVLLSMVARNWKKLARVVAEAMDATEDQFPSVPDIFFAQRVIALRDSGLVQSQGNLNRMRCSEVRLPQTAP